MTGERFYVHESVGYMQTGDRAGRPVTEVMVLDRAYCHRVVWSSYTTTYLTRHRKRVTARRWPLRLRRAHAAALAARLNAE